jgi:hypothetical protein
MNVIEMTFASGLPCGRWSILDSGLTTSGSADGTTWAAHENYYRVIKNTAARSTSCKDQ